MNLLLNKLKSAIVLTIILTASCTSRQFTIKGTIDLPEYEGLKVMKYTGGFFNRESIVDSTVVLNGEYCFKGSVEEPTLCSIVVVSSNHEQSIYKSFALENSSITLVTDTNKVTRVSGTPNNDNFQKFEDENDVMTNLFVELRKSLKEAKQEGIDTKPINQKIDSIYSLRNQFTYDYVKNNINNPAAWSLLHNTAVMCDNFELLKELIAGANERTKLLNDYTIIVDRIAVLEKSSVGQPFVDFTMLDPNGKEVSISDYAGKGNYLLIDFWASWCGPCREEMPNVINLYNKYKNKGLDIVGVSLDNKKESWTKAIKQLGLPWHHMSDLKGWDCEGSNLYGVTAVPNAVLLDKEGIIIARGVCGPELYAQIESRIK